MKWGRGLKGKTGKKKKGSRKWDNKTKEEEFFFTENHEGVKKFVLQVFPPGTEGFLRVALLQEQGR